MPRAALSLGAAYEHTQAIPQTLPKAPHPGSDPGRASGLTLRDPPPTQLGSPSIPAPPAHIPRSGCSVFMHSVLLGKRPLKPQHAVVGLPPHLLGNSIHTLSAPDSSLSAAWQALQPTSILCTPTQRTTALPSLQQVGKPRQTKESLSAHGKVLDSRKQFQLSQNVI